MKCDEGKPACQRCIRAHRVCEGYEDPFRASTRTEVLRRLLLSKSGPSPPPGTSISGSETERRAFHRFRDRTVEDLTAYFSSDFWSRIVLQLSHEEPCVQHAVVALGAAHEQFEEFGIGRRVNDNKESKYFALQQYGKAMGRLKQRLAEEKELSAEVALVCCLVFISFTSVQGDFNMALEHLQMGLNILKEWTNRDKKGDQNPSSQESLVMGEEFLRMFSRLDLQATAFLDSQLLPPDNIAAEPQVDYKTLIPRTARLFEGSASAMQKSFKSLDDARLTLEKLQNWVFLFIVKNYLYRVDQTNAPQEILDERDCLNKMMHLWQLEFDEFLRLPDNEKLDERGQLGGLVLLVHHKSAKMMITGALTPDILYEKHQADFEYIITLSEQLQDKIEKAGCKSKRCARFSSEVGVIAPVFFTCNQAVDEALRLRAIKLLKRMNRREGMWDSAVAATLAEKILTDDEEFENGDMSALAASVPELASMLGVNMDSVPYLECTSQFVENLKGQNVAWNRICAEAHFERTSGLYNWWPERELSSTKKVHGSGLEMIKDGILRQIMTPGFLESLSAPTSSVCSIAKLSDLLRDQSKSPRPWLESAGK